MNYDARNGYSAFPSNDEDGMASKCGMTLRDYFAAKWMQGYVASCVTEEQKEVLEADYAIASSAYEMADEMIRARGTQ